MLASLRWDVDQVITNYDGERVWLKPCLDRTGKRIGITECCPEQWPCDHHAAIADRRSDHGKWYLRRWPDPNGLSWLGKLNYYVLQWTGRRLAIECDDQGRPLGRLRIVRMRPREGWL